MKTEEKHSRGEADKTGRKKKMPVGRMILLDVLAIAVGLVVFALFHHVLPTYYGLFTEKTEPVVLMTLPPQPTPEPAAAPAGETENGEQDEPETPEEPEATPESVRVYNGVWGEKFADKFTETLPAPASVKLGIVCPPVMLATPVSCLSLSSWLLLNRSIVRLNTEPLSCFSSGLK